MLIVIHVSIYKLNISFNEELYVCMICLLRVVVGWLIEIAFSRLIVGMFFPATGHLHIGGEGEGYRSQTQAGDQRLEQLQLYVRPVQDSWGAAAQG